MVGPHLELRQEAGGRVETVQELALLNQLQMDDSPLTVNGSEAP
jgi:hypothetical protein